MIRVTVNFYNANPNTIWNVLARKFGREPTNAEAKVEVHRIMEEVTVDLASQGKLPHQRKSA